MKAPQTSYRYHGELSRPSRPCLVFKIEVLLGWCCQSLGIKAQVELPLWNNNPAFLENDYFSRFQLGLVSTGIDMPTRALCQRAPAMTGLEPPALLRVQSSTNWYGHLLDRIKVNGDGFLFLALRWWNWVGMNWSSRINKFSSAHWRFCSLVTMSLRCQRRRRHRRRRRHDAKALPFFLCRFLHFRD